MRVLLDECLPHRLKRELVGHETMTATEMGWAGKRNGTLLCLAASEFDVFLTVDRNLQYQQNLTDFDIAVVVLIAVSNSLADLRPLVPDILERLDTGNHDAVLTHKTINRQIESTR